jgi:hypothetical protein
VVAGPNQSITPLVAAVLDGTVTDDGLPNPPGTVTTTWSKVSGPGTVAFGSQNAVDTTATFSAPGAYVLRLTASDSVLSSSSELTVDVNAATLHFSVGTVQTLSGVPVTTHDVVAFDGTTFSVLLDGEDVGLDASSENIDALAVLANGHILVSTTGNISVPGVSGKDEDVLEFTPTLLGGTSAGTWSMRLDGSVVGLEAAGEDVDAVELLDNGHLLVSTRELVSVAGVTGEDEDVLDFDPVTGVWALYFDGTDVGLTNASEDVDGFGLSGTTIYLSTTGNFSVTGAAGADEDVVRFVPTQLGPTTSGTFSLPLYFDGSVLGLAGNDLASIDLP